jgi:hypothetical protein
MMAAEPEASSALTPEHTIIHDSEPKLPKSHKVLSYLSIFAFFWKYVTSIPTPILSKNKRIPVFYMLSSTQHFMFPLLRTGRVFFATLYNSVTPRLPVFDFIPWAKLRGLIPHTTVESVHSSHEGNVPTPNDCKNQKITRYDILTRSCLFL